jgi:hypothetical protein
MRYDRLESSLPIGVVCFAFDIADWFCGEPLHVVFMIGEQEYETARTFLNLLNKN